MTTPTPTLIIDVAVLARRLGLAATDHDVRWQLEQAVQDATAMPDRRAQYPPGPSSTAQRWYGPPNGPTSQPRHKRHDDATAVYCRFGQEDEA